MPTESDLVELLRAVGDRAPDADHTLDVLSPRLRAAAPSHRSRRVLAVAAAVVTVAGVGIGSSVVLQSGNTNTAAGYVDAEPTTNHETYELPLDRYAASATQERTLQLARYGFAQRCSRTAGVVVPNADLPAADPAARFLTDYMSDVRPLTVRQARRLGYSFDSPKGPAIEVAIDRLDGASRAIYNRCDSAATGTLLRGAKPVIVPDIGTIDAAGFRHPIRDDDLYVHNVYDNEVYPLVVHTPAVRHAQQRWSACMADHGYPGLASTVDAIVRQRGSAAAAAKRQAVQDVKCKEATGFMTVWVEALREAQRAVISKHRDALIGFEKRLKIRLANAARVLDQP